MGLNEDGVVDYLERGEGEDEPWAFQIGQYQSFIRPRDREAWHAELKDLFEESGMPLILSDDIYSQIMSQNSVRLPILAALRLAGGSLDKLVRRGDLLKLMILGIREALVLIRAAGARPEPKSLDLYRWVPSFITANMIKHRFETPVSKLGIEEFGRNSVAESAYLWQQLMRRAEELQVQRSHLLYLASAFETESSDTEDDSDEEINID